MVVVVVGDDHIQVAGEFRQLPGRNGGRCDPSGDQRPFRKHGIDEPGCSFQANEEGPVADPGNEITLPHGEDALLQPRDEFREKTLLFVRVIPGGTQLPCEQIPEAATLHGHPGIEEPAPLLVRGIEVFAFSALYVLQPLGLVEGNRIVAAGEEKSIRNTPMTPRHV